MLRGKPVRWACIVPTAPFARRGRCGGRSPARLRRRSAPPDSGGAAGAKSVRVEILRDGPASHQRNVPVIDPGPADHLLVLINRHKLVLEPGIDEVIVAAEVERVDGV